MIKPHNPNSEFELGGINHVALVCSDMARTVDFYSDVLGMPLIKSLDLPGGMGQHFFFDAGNGDCVAFFWFADAPDGVPGLSVAGRHPRHRRDHQRGRHHEPLGVPRARREVRRLPSAAQGQGRAGRAGAQPRRERAQVAATVHPGVYVRSFYFQDPDGITLEFACWTKEFTATTRRPYRRRRADRRIPAAHSGRQSRYRLGLASSSSSDASWSTS